MEHYNNRKQHTLSQSSTKWFQVCQLVSYRHVAATIFVGEREFCVGFGRSKEYLGDNCSVYVTVHIVA